MNKKLIKLYEDKQALIQEMDGLVNGDGGMTDEQQRRFNQCDSKIRRINQEMEQEKAGDAREKANLRTMKTVDDYPDYDGKQRRDFEAGSTPNLDEGVREFQDLKSGEKLYSFDLRHRYSDFAQANVAEGINPDDISPGRYLRSLITGNWKASPAEFELYAADGSTKDNATGGYLIPDLVAQKFIDYARNRSVMMKAGAQTIPMSTENLAVCRVESDPTVSIHSENTEEDLQAPDLARVSLYSRTLIAIISVSRELLEDASNADSIIETILSGAVANRMDSMAINGDAGSGEPTGLLIDSNLATETGVGSVDWSAFLSALKTLEENNVDDSNLSIIYSPAVKYDLSSLYTGDGTNAAKFPRPLPDALSDVRRLVTNSVDDDAKALIGNFGTCLWGQRQDMRLEATAVGDSAFRKHSVYIKCFLRGDWAVQQPNHICRLEGIS